MSIEASAQSGDPDIVAINQELGRSLRVLHIGNIANNAYNNACIQRRHGIEADVLCFDYYHVMGTPEWEDGGLTTRPDPDLPNWWETNLKGFRRPDWYVQGPLILCLEYLTALRKNNRSALEGARRRLSDAYVDLLRQRAERLDLPFTDPRSGEPQLVPLSRRLSGANVREIAGAAVRAGVSRLFASVVRAPERVRSALQDFHVLVVHPALQAATADPPQIAGPSAILALYNAMRLLMGRTRRSRTEIDQLLRGKVPAASHLTWSRLALRSLKVAIRMASAIVMLPFWFLIPGAYKDNDSAARLVRARAEKARACVSKLLDHPMVGSVSAERRGQLEGYVSGGPLLMGSLLEEYDIVQGYSIDGIIPLVNGHRAFASYEHGTLRDLPFEDSITGLICRVSYLHSPAVFVTNTDVLPSVARLGLKPDRVHYLPHAFDDKKLRDWRSLQNAMMPPKSEVVFFSPTRQHWRDAALSLTKGNDVMLRAAGRIWSEGRRFRIILVEWGQDVDATKQLIGELGYSAAVNWVPPMGKQDLWRAYCTSHAVLDQFTLPALGGVGFETLTLGRRLITRTDQTTLEHFFGAAPPVLAAGSIEETAASMRQVIDDPEDRQGTGEAGARWIQRYHSAERTVSIQATVYRRLLGIGAPTVPNQVAADTTL